MAKVCRGVAHAHVNGTIHRDLKPQNILVREDGEPLVLDFGIAKHREDTTLTASQSTPGTPSHMAPEQFEPGSPSQGGSGRRLGAGHDPLPGAHPRASVPGTQPRVGFVPDRPRQADRLCASSTGSCRRRSRTSFSSASRRTRGSGRRARRVLAESLEPRRSPTSCIRRGAGGRAPPCWSPPPLIVVAALVLRPWNWWTARP